MTVVLDDRIEMAEIDDLSLDEMFERLGEAFPEGFKIEIIGGAVFVSPQRRRHWKIIRMILRQLEDHFGADAEIDSDVRMDFPGGLNGLCPDLAKIFDEAEPDENDRFSPEDVELIVEIISRGTARNDYGSKKTLYARAGIPLYIIVDPYTGKCHAFGGPEGDVYENELTAKFGDPLDLKPLGLDLTLSTDKFPRD